MDAKNTTSILSADDHEKYGAHLDDCDMTDEQKKEFIDQVWLIANSFVDLAFDQSPVQTALNDQDQELKETIQDLANAQK